MLFVFAYIGDERILEYARVACYSNIDNDARDEGTEYDGDCGAFSFLRKGDKALGRNDSNAKLSEVQLATFLLFTASKYAVKFCVRITLQPILWLSTVGERTLIFLVTSLITFYFIHNVTPLFKRFPPQSHQ